MSDKWKRVDDDDRMKSPWELFENLMGVEHHTVENIETGETREITTDSFWGPTSVGEAIEKGKFDE